MFKTVLFPIDRSPESREAAETVVELVKFHSSRLVVLSVVPEPNEDDGDPTEAIAAAAELLKGAQAMFEKVGLKTEAIERQGMPSFTICDVADEIDASLIVMGCRGLGLTSEGAAESTSSRVINLSPCPVLIVP